MRPEESGGRRPKVEHAFDHLSSERDSIENRDAPERIKDEQPSRCCVPHPHSSHSPSNETLKHSTLIMSV